MPNLMTYMAHQGQEDFKTLPINELDICILNELAYLPIGKVDERLKKTMVALVDVIDRYNREGDELDPSFMVTKKRLALMDAVATSPRFANLSLGYYVNDIDVDYEKQFAAVVMTLPEIKHTQIIFRGTDDSLIGWKEDLNMTYRREIPAQRSALNYLTDILSDMSETVILSGHSKGGNLAIYAASFVSETYQEQIRSVYAFDAPGLHEQALETAGYKAIRDKIKAYQPRESVVGVMLSSDVEATIVESEAKGLAQHDPFYWQVEAGQFQTCEKPSPLSLSLEKTFAQWMETYSKTELKTMIDTFFDLFFSLGIDSLDDLGKDNLKQIGDFLAEFSDLDEAKKTLLKGAALNLISIYHQNSLALFKQNSLDNLQSWFDKTKNDWTSFITAFKDD